LRGVVAPWNGKQAWIDPGNENGQGEKTNQQKEGRPKKNKSVLARWSSNSKKKKAIGAGQHGKAWFLLPKNGGDKRPLLGHRYTITAGLPRSLLLGNS